MSRIRLFFGTPGWGWQLWGIGNRCWFIGLSIAQPAKLVAPAPNPWQRAVEEELISCLIFQKKHEDDPNLALSDVIDWHVAVALDPRVSKDAQDLIDRGKIEAADEIIDLIEVMEDDLGEEAP